MPVKDLQEFLRTLEQKRELKRIRVSVDSYLEISEITDRVVKQGGPALLFENVKGSPYPVVTNIFGSLERMQLALGVESLDEIGRRFAELFEPPPLNSLFDKLKALPKLAELSNFFPKLVRGGSSQEIVETEPDLTRLPVLTTWPEDAGPFITLPLVITRDPITGRQNIGMYRMQVFDGKTTGMHWHLHKDGAMNYISHLRQGKRMEVAVALGADPVTIYAATAPVPAGIDELTFAGFLRKAPVEVVKAKTVDLEVPAHAEFILEGYVEPGELRVEGPFGDHTGFYSPAEEYPVFHLTAITRRKNPVYPATVVGIPPMEDAFLGKATERIFLPLLKLQLPEVVDMNLPVEGVFHNLAIIAIDKRYPGQAKKVMSAIWGMGQMMYTKVILVVDADVDVHNPSQVVWRSLSSIDPGRDIVIVDGPLDALDHASPTPKYGSKMGIDATTKLPEEGHPRIWPHQARMSEEVMALVTRRWKEYGLENL